MEFNKHLNLVGKHAVLNPSGYSWLNYFDNTEALYSRYKSQYAQTVGTIAHEYAEKRVRFGLKIGKSIHDKNNLLFYLLDHGVPRNAINLDIIFQTVSMYVNDAIGFGLEPEVILYYSDECFGTADAISFRKNTLRIHDLKTGLTPAHMEQLMIYAGLFCLEYGEDPRKIETELRIYQNGEALTYAPEGKDVYEITDKIIKACNYISEIKYSEN